MALQTGQPSSGSSSMGSIQKFMVYQKSVCELDAKVKALLDTRHESAQSVGSAESTPDPRCPAAERLFTEFFEKFPHKKHLNSGAALEILNALRSDCGISEKKTTFLKKYHRTSVFNKGISPQNKWQGAVKKLSL